MPDEEFANPRLAQIYDYLDSDRSDLIHYIGLIEEFKAQSVLDLGCGTGTLLCLLAGKGYELVGVDPAAASLMVAKRKEGAENVRWIIGDAASVPNMNADIALMTGNVAQVFVEDEDWLLALTSVRNAISSTGHFVFESRDPEKCAWEKWNRSSTLSLTDIPGVGLVESWVETTDVSLPLVSFKWTFQFRQDGSVLKSDSTLRFREIDEVENSLQKAGFNLLEIRDAPDRPGMEHIYIAQSSQE